MRPSLASLLSLVYLAALGAPSFATVQETRIDPDPTTSASIFGWATAIDGDTLAVADVLDFGGPTPSGAVTVYRRSGTTWSLEQRLAPIGAVINGQVGWSLDLHDDTLIVGGRSGDVFVFERSGTTWTQKSGPSDGLWGPHPKVAVHGDRIAIKAFNGMCVFRREGTSWASETVALLPGDGPVGMDGDTLANTEFVFERSGTAWTQTAQLTTDDGGQLESTNDGVAVSGDTIVVGSESNDEAGVDAGAAYVFVRSGTTWVQQAKLLASDAEAHMQFGRAVDIDGDRIVIGAPNSQQQDPNLSRAYLFVRSGTSWIEEQIIVPSASGAVGIGVGISGEDAVVGVPYARPDGAAFVYRFVDPPGTALCFGDGSGAACPCANESGASDAGCLNSTGAGMTIAGTGTASVTADDLVLVAGNVPAGATGIFYGGDTPIGGGNPFYDGLQCVGGNVRRFQGIASSNGVASDTGFVAQDPSGVFFMPGVAIDFQYWSRDLGRAAPCGLGANLSPSYRVVWMP